MESQFVTYEIALKLKELGFDEPCLACFDEHRNYQISYAGEEIINLYGGYTAKLLYDPSNYPCILAPLWQQAIDFIREKYDIVIDIGEVYRDEGKYHFAVNYIWEFFEGTYYEAREQAILKAIELIKINNYEVI